MTTGESLDQMDDVVVVEKMVAELIRVVVHEVLDLLGLTVVQLVLIYEDQAVEVVLLK